MYPTEEVTWDRVWLKKIERREKDREVASKQKTVKWVRVAGESERVSERKRRG